MKARLFTNFLFAFIIYALILTIIGYILAMVIWNGYLPLNFMMYAMPTVSIITSIILGIIFGKRIALRIEKLAGVANEIKFGNYNVRIKPGADDEIGDVVNTLPSTGSLPIQNNRRLVRRPCTKENVIDVNIAVNAGHGCRF